MAEDDLTPNDPPDDDETAAPEDESNDIRSLRRKARAADADRARAEAAERQLALVQAKVDTTSPVGAMFARDYKGDLTIEAIQSAWDQLGVSISADEPDDEPEPDESAAERSAVAAGAAHDTGVQPEKPAKQRARERAEAARARGEREVDGHAEFLSELAGAALAGDTSVLADRPARKRLE
jgi:hypothetical protein